MSTSKETIAEVQKILIVLKDFPQWKNLNDQTKLILLSALAQRNLVDIIRSSVSDEMVGLILRGLLSNPDFAACVMIYALGLPNEAPVASTPDSGGGKAEPVPVSLAEAAEKQIAAEVLQALGGLAAAAPRVPEHARMMDFVERSLAEPRKHPLWSQVSAWVN